MIARIKALWTERLRSGEYRQIHRRLSDTSNGRCCLGVLCDLAVEAGVVRREVAPGDHVGRVIYVAVDNENDTGEGLLPMAVADWAGLSSRDPVVIPTPSGSMAYRTASELNDEKHVPFHGIADAIDGNL